MNSDIITITEDRQIVCSKCKYEPSQSGKIPIEWVISYLEKHYKEEHTQLRDNKKEVL